VALVTGSAVATTSDASAQAPAEVDLAKSASQSTAAPGEDFIFFLSWSCSSLTVACEGATVTDTLPAQVSRAEADVDFSGNFADVEYIPTTGRAVFALFSPLPAGTTAQIAITVRFPAGTTPGTVATNQATIDATNADPVDSNQVSVTARAASEWTVAKSRVTSAAQLDTPFTYRVSVTLAAGGTQNVDGARFVDTLPPGAEFVSATQGGTYDPGTHAVTWALGTLVPAASTAVTFARDVTVIFPSATFNAGDTPVNTVEAFGSPAGEPSQSLGRATLSVTLRPTGDITAASKRSGLGSLGPGQADTYTIAGTNPNPGPLDAFTVTEDLPAQLAMVQDGGPNLTGTGAAPQVSWRPLGTGAFQPVATSPSGGGWGATIPAAADQIRLGYGTVPAGVVGTARVRAGIPANGIGRDGIPVAAGANIRNCITVTGSSGGVTAVPRSACTDQVVVPLAVELSKTRTSAAVVQPSGDVSWAIAVGVDPSSASDLVNPVVSDCLPPGIDLVDPSNPASPANGSVAGLPAPVLTRSACGTGQVLLTWTWPGFTLPRGSSGTITLATRVANTAPPGLLTNLATLRGANLAQVVERSSTVTVTSTTLLVGTKFVQGDLDPTMVGFGAPGRTSPGGSATYQATIANISDVAITNLVVVDTLPKPGDTGVLTTAARGSGWQPLFAGGVTTGAPATVSYSRSHNPCRPELFVAPGCDPPGWTTAPPNPLSSVGAIRVDYGSSVLPPGGAVRIGWSIATPAGAPVGPVAWNSFGYTAVRQDNRQPLAPSEPRKVGLVVASDTPPGPGISIVKLVNGVSAPDPPGPSIPPGAPVVFTYVVTNSGDLTLVDVVVVDDRIGTIACPQTTLGPGEAMTCTAPTQIAVEGQYVNVAAATAQPVDSSGRAVGLPISDTTKGHYLFRQTRSRADITLRKLVNGQHVPDAPGLLVPAGTTVRFTYVVTNTGQVTLRDVRLVDDQVSGLSCPRTRLLASESMECSAPVQQAVVGNHTNVATVRAVTATTPTRVLDRSDEGHYYNTLPDTGASTGQLAALAVVLVALGGALVLAAGLSPRLAVPSARRRSRP
jgi:uncharacterized repeat protein (TIGR01451 family)